jgi:dTDP-L-rhamnose 4-epimerase
MSSWPIAWPWKYPWRRRGHCFANTTLAHQVLKYKPQVTQDDGLQQFASWVESQINFDHYAEVYVELEARGLTR